MIRFHRLAVVAGLAATIVLAGCMPLAQQQLAQATAEAVASSRPMPTAIADAVATVATRSLRVREQPTVNSPQIGSILNGEQYRVSGRSSDGQWFALEIPQLAAGAGWVSTDLVSVSGAIIDVPIFDVSVLPTPAPTPAVAAVVLPTVTPGIVVAGEMAAEEAPAAETPAAEAVQAQAAPTETVAAKPVAAEPVAAEPAPTKASATEASPTALAVQELLPTATPEASDAVLESAALTATAPLAPTPLTPTPTVVAPGPGLAAVNADVRLRVRAEPNAESPIVGYGYRGEVFPVIERSADGAWTRIGGSADARENANGGWVATEFLLLGE